MTDVVDWFSSGAALVDLAAAGLAIAAIGSWYLARALLLTPSEVFSRTHALSHVLTPIDEERRLAAHTMDAFIGAVYLVLGFALQLAGLALSLAIAPPPMLSRTGLVAVIVAVAALALALALGSLVHRIAYPRFLAPLARVRAYLLRRRMASLPHPGDAHEKETSATGDAGGATDPKPRINSETVKALLENAKELARDEEARGASLKQRAGWLLGFDGVVLTIVLTQARELTKDGLGGVLTPIAGALVLFAVVLLLDSARYALKTLSVVQLWHFGVEEAEAYPTWAFVAKEPADARGEMLHGWVRQFSEERQANNDKAKQLEDSFERALWAFAFLAALATIVCLRLFGV